MPEELIDNLLFVGMFVVLLILFIVAASYEQRVKKTTVITVDWDTLLQDIQQDKEPDQCEDDSRYW